MTKTYPAVLTGFDGNNRRYPTLLTSKLRKAGFVEHSLAKEGPDELRFLTHRSQPVKVLSHTQLPGFEGMHHIQVVKFKYQGQTVGALFFNSGRGGPEQTRAALVKLASAAKGLTDDCDYVVVLVVEFGEGDKNPHFEFNTLNGLLDESFKSFLGNHRECIWVSRKSGKKESEYETFRGTSVKHQSPTRGEALVELKELLLLLVVWHSQAGAYNGHRAHDVFIKLMAGWHVVFNRTAKTIRRFLLTGKYK